MTEVPLDAAHLLGQPPAEPDMRWRLRTINPMFCPEIPAATLGNVMGVIKQSVDGGHWLNVDGTLVSPHHVVGIECLGPAT